MNASRMGILCVTGLSAFLASNAFGIGDNDFEPLSSNPQELYEFNGFLYCVADDGIRGRELWRVTVPSGEAERVADIARGMDSNPMDKFYTFNGRLYFRVMDPVHGGELWWSDGIPGGRTERVMRFDVQSPKDGLVGIYGDTGTTMLLGVGNPEGSWSMWTSDGTTDGTRLLTHPGGTVFTSRSFGAVRWNGGLYFGGDGFNSEGSRDNGLWKTDGTSAGTTLVAAFAREPTGLFAVDELGIFFSGYTEASGSEPWFSKGTPGTTFQLADIYEGATSSEPEEVIACADPRPNEPTRFYFRAYHPKTGRELWESDGTKAGTRLAWDIAPGAASGAPYKLTPSDGGFYFNAFTEDFGTELWFYDISFEEKRTRLTDINPSYLSSAPYAFQVMPDSPRLIFSAHGPEGEEVWSSGPSPGDLDFLRDIYEGPEDSEPYHTTIVGNYAVFSARDVTHGRELWITDGNSVNLLCDIFEDQIRNPSSFPEFLTPFGDHLLFVADDIEHGKELWILRKGASEPELLKDIYPKSLGSQPQHLTVVGDVVYFTAEAPEAGRELFKTDGTAAGTAKVIDINTEPGEGSNPKHLIAWNGALIFSAYRDYDGEELWGVLPGKRPEIIANICPNEESSSPKNFVIWKDHVYFQADDGTHGFELWRTDGTTEGTVMVKDIVAIPFEKLSYGEMRAHGDRLYISAHTPAKGQELWAFTDLETGPQLVGDIALAAPFRMQRRMQAATPPQGAE